jgi:hypothetical protein
LSSEDGKSTIVVFGFKNKHTKPVKITGLSGKGVMLTFDKEGYSNPLLHYSNEVEITIPNEAAAKHDFHFEGNASEVKHVRIWTKSYPVSE